MLNYQCGTNEHCYDNEEGVFGIRGDIRCVSYGESGTP